jgi:EAL domain-containing protein (putative c-di-GMP-specific phosphodiesterase class I)
MYSAKAGGKARHEVFNKKMHEEALARLNLSTDLRRAVEHGQFQLRFQPIVELEPRRLCGFEALVRWEHPERGTIAPADFIERAEETGLITQIGVWVLENACRELARWHETVDPDRSIGVSVNVSKRQVAAPGLVREVERVLEETGLEGRHLKLEITESVIMANPDSVAGVLEELRALGVEVHMDDFGTGYSSLSYLHRFPIDVLKIDREFMSTLSENHDYSGVIRTVVTLAHQLDIRVTVEGVETPEHVDQLALIGCDYAQGFRFGTPLSGEEAQAMIESGLVWPPQQQAA